MTDWSPEAYLQFAGERSRPARDLLAQIPLISPNLIFDLGCGPGNSTALLERTFAHAEIIGVDNSPAMLIKARETLPHCAFIEADLASWQPDSSVDVLFSNATFQWLSGHASILLRLLKGLRSGGVLAVQMPDNLNEPSHQLMRLTAADGPWADKLRDTVGAREALLTPQDYYGLLRPFCARLDIWHTIYNHMLDGAQGIVDFVASTGLRPFLKPLKEPERTEFVGIYSARIADAYPPVSDGKALLRFPRLFIVAQV
jgi:trans-aconitate 2-methyltransferase